MIDALVSGRLTAKPVERVGPSGKSFVTAKMLASSGEGEQLFCNVICFEPSAQSALMALDNGDSVSVSGPLSVRLYSDKQGQTKASLSLVAHVVLTPYHANRKRRAMQPADDKTQDFLTHEREYP